MDHLDLDEAFSPSQSWRDGGKESTEPADVRVNGAGWIWIISAKKGLETLLSENSLCRQKKSSSRRKVIPFASKLGTASHLLSKHRVRPAWTQNKLVCLFQQCKEE